MESVSGLSGSNGPQGLPVGRELRDRSQPVIHQTTGDPGHDDRLGTGQQSASPGPRRPYCVKTARILGPAGEGWGSAVLG